MSKILIDTNILVYAKDIDSIYHDAAMSFLKRSDDFYVTTKNLIEYFAVVTKGEKPLLDPQEAWKDIEEFSAFFRVLYPTPLSHQLLEVLILRYSPKGILIHDFEISAIALANEIKTIATFNKVDFQRLKEIEVVVPE